MTVRSLSPRADTTQYRPPFYSGSNCSVYANYYPDPALPYSIDPNPDISGIGVILAFLITAYATLFFTIVAYWTGLVPDELLNDVDRRVFKGSSRRARSGWSAAFRGALRSCSDQQMVTGIAILAAAFAGVQTVTVYHWRAVVYLAWMSSNVHLTTLTVAMVPEQQRRHQQKQEKQRLGATRGAAAARCARLAGMLTLFALLVAALIPTMSRNFSDAMMKHPYMGYWDQSGLFAFTPSDPAVCLWLPVYRANPTTDSIVSLSMLTGSYTWKAAGVLFGSRGQRRLLRCEPVRRAVPPLLRRAAAWRGQRNRAFRILTAWPYALLVGLYALFVAALDFAASLAATLIVLSVGLAWGTINLLLPRQQMADFIGPEEDDWSFGQCLPMLLLLLPIVSISEEFSKRGNEETASCPASSGQTMWARSTIAAAAAATARPRAGTVELPLLSHRRTQSSTAAPSSMPRVGTVTTTSSGQSSESKYRFPPSYNTGNDFTFLPHGKKAEELPTVVALRTVETQYTEDEERMVTREGTIDEREKHEREAAVNGDHLLYSSRFFRSLIWLILLCVALTVAFVFVMETSGLVNAYIEDRVVLLSGLAGSIATGVLLAWIAIGSMWSSVDKLL